jgi:hypothetical protein
MCRVCAASLTVAGYGLKRLALGPAARAFSRGFPTISLAKACRGPVLPALGLWHRNLPACAVSTPTPVAVELSQEAGSLSGLGCYGGLPTPKLPELSSACRPLSGTVDGRHVQFAFAAESFTYAANVYASADGQRTSGDFHDTATWRASAFTWLRIGPDQPALQRSGQSTATSLALEERSGRYQLEGLVDHYGQLGYIALYGHLGTIASSLGLFGRRS